MSKWSKFDLSFLAALMAGLFAFVCFTNNDWIMGIFFAVFCFFFIFDYQDKIKLAKIIQELNEELIKTQNELKKK